MKLAVQRRVSQLPKATRNGGMIIKRYVVFMIFICHQLAKRQLHVQGRAFPHLSHMSCLFSYVPRFGVFRRQEREDGKSNVSWWGWRYRI